MVDHRNKDDVEIEEDASEEEIDHDAMCKDLLKGFYKEFIELFYFELSERIDWKDPVKAGTETIRKFKSQKKQKRNYSDLTMRVRCGDTGLPILIHVEVQEQTKYLKEFPKRMFIYASRLIEEHGYPVFPIVLFTFDTPRLEQARSFELGCLGKDVISFKYEVVQLNRLSGKDYANKMNPVAVALAAKMHIAKEDRPVVKLRCWSTLQQLQITEKDKENTAEFIEVYLKLEPSEELVFEKLLERVKNKNEVIEMVSTWRREGKLELVLKQLEYRLGTLDDVTRKEIEKLSSSKIDKLAVDLLSFADSEQLKDWLKQKR